MMPPAQRGRRRPGQPSPWQSCKLSDDGRNHAGADGTAAFTDGETQAFFHGDGAISRTVIVTLSPA